MYVEAPERLDFTGPSVFLAGGITGCEDWQSVAYGQLKHDCTVLNPRRADFPIDDPSAAEEQIEWEFNALHHATAVLFWFPPSEATQPIALYELGRHLAMNPRVAVGADWRYPRHDDVVIQTRLARPKVNVRTTLWGTCQDALDILRSVG